ncbi:DUF2158 domain-containing protein [Bradyrhizobium sp. CER78]|uniref:YodC family protein n=1 Tax=Bradyrhizobium sp. CER78 TaxID=3039162 RepID=UPI0024468546|nr:DUF2158 domain-containing protein [Bradyrhizobium sp. CER78]MDH2383611.1 DUF2158 domain-containing protein [Bradyrhizobium sp. CER78]
MANFKAGDTVRLKSGGPLMTVTAVQNDGELWCEWFDKSDKPQGKSFSPHSVVEDDGGPVIG